MDHRATTVPRRVMQQRWELIYPCPQVAQRNEATWHNIVNPAYVGVWRRSNECDVTLTIEIPQEWSLWKSLGSDPCSLPSPPVHRKTNNCIHVVVQYDVMTELLHVSNRSRFFLTNCSGWDSKPHWHVLLQMYLYNTLFQVKQEFCRYFWWFSNTQGTQGFVSRFIGKPALELHNS